MRRLLDMINEIRTIGHGAGRSDDERERALLFPKDVRGAHLTMVDPTLEFVKMATHVMSLVGTGCRHCLVPLRGDG